MMLWKHVAYWLRLAELYFLMAWSWDADGFEAYASVPPEEALRLAYGSSPHRHSLAAPPTVDILDRDRRSI